MTIGPAGTVPEPWVYVTWPPLNVTVAGEATAIQVPELDVCFDIGICTRAALSSPTIALSHAHMDHLGGLPYWFSQRYFQKIGGETHMPEKSDGQGDGKPKPPVGRCVCHPELEQGLRGMMGSWEPLERQRTPFDIVPLEPEHDLEIKNNILLRAIATRHPRAAAAPGASAGRPQAFAPGPCYRFKV